MLPSLHRDATSSEGDVDRRGPVTMATPRQEALQRVDHRVADADPVEKAASSTFSSSTAVRRLGCRGEDRERPIPASLSEGHMGEVGPGESTNLRSRTAAPTALRARRPRRATPRAGRSWALRTHRPEARPRLRASADDRGSACGRGAALASARQVGAARRRWTTSYSVKTGSSLGSMAQYA